MIEGIIYLAKSDEEFVRIYVDGTGRLEKDWQARLGERDFVGQLEIDSLWPAGYGSMTVAAFPAP